MQQQHTMFTREGENKNYGPVMLPNQACGLTASQQEKIRRRSGLLAEVDDGQEHGIWEGQREPDNAGMLWP